eukprot:COSAG02_NODE_11205_length_1772_cov_1.271369_2_plen_41_part_00
MSLPYKLILNINELHHLVNNIYEFDSWKGKQTGTGANDAG